MRSRTLAAALALVASATLPVRAQGPPQPPPQPRQGGAPPAEPRGEDRWWRDHALLPRLDLEPARRARLEETYAAARSRLDELSAAVADAEAELAEATHAREPDERAFTPRLDRLVAARAQLESEHVGLLLTVRSMLTPAQWQRLQQLQRANDPGPGREGEPGMEGDRGRPDERRGPGGPPTANGHGPRAGGPAPPGPHQPRFGPQQATGSPPQGPPPGTLPPGPPLPPGAWWRDSQIALELAIEPRQITALDAAFEARRAGLAEARAALEREERTLGTLLPAPSLDLPAALAAAQRVARARAELDRAFLALRFAQWQALRPEQREQLRHPPRR